MTSVIPRWVLNYPSVTAESIGFELTIKNADVVVTSLQAVSISRAEANRDTVVALVLSPAMNAWVGWRPRARDVTREKTTFYAEMSQMYVPAAGVIRVSIMSLSGPRRASCRK